MNRYQGKVVVVTGGTTGIGLAAAKAFLAEGASVVATGRSADALRSAAEALGPSALVLRSDTSSLADIDALVARVKEARGGVDVLFINAGIARFAPLEVMQAEVFDEIFSVNVRGAYFTVQRFAPLLRKGGSVVLNTSVANEKGMPGTSVYAASKAALRSLARTLSSELLPKGVRVNAVSPGPIDTPIYDKLGMDAAGKSAFERTMTETNPMRRFGTSEEVAGAVLFLASSHASFTTGAELAVDGGMTQL